MPHVSSGGGGDDLASSDEVKVYKDEGGEDEDDQQQSEHLSEDKFGLVSESEEAKIGRTDVDSGKESANGVDGGKLSNHLLDGAFYKYSTLFNPYHYSPSAAIAGLASHVIPPPFFPFYNGDFSHPPPAHIGISPVPVDHKRGFPGPPLYPMATLAAGQFSPLYAPEFSQVPWPGSSGYSGSLVGPYGGPVPSNSPLSRFSPGLFSSASGDHPALLSLTGKSSSSLLDVHRLEMKEHHAHEKKKPYVKKPLNAFMIFMKEMRQKVIEECTLKESAAINQILGRKWHGLSQSEQAKYYELARQEKERHMKQFPGWSARDNYATHTKKKRKKHEVCENAKDGSGGKKCRARFGLDKQSQWCHPCRRKKRCVRFYDNGSCTEHENDDDDEYDDVDSDDDCETGDVTMSAAQRAGAAGEQQQQVSSPRHQQQVQRHSPIVTSGTAASSGDAHMDDLDLVTLWSPL